MKQQLIDEQVGWWLETKNWDAVFSSRTKEQVRDEVTTLLTTAYEAGEREGYAKAMGEARKQIICQHDIDGDVCDCCRANYDRIDDLFPLIYNNNEYVGLEWDEQAYRQKTGIKRYTLTEDSTPTDNNKV